MNFGQGRVITAQVRQNKLSSDEYVSNIFFLLQYKTSISNILLPSNVIVQQPLHPSMILGSEQQL